MAKITDPEEDPSRVDMNAAVKLVGGGKVQSKVGPREKMRFKKHPLGNLSPCVAFGKIVGREGGKAQRGGVHGSQNSFEKLWGGNTTWRDGGEWRPGKTWEIGDYNYEKQITDSGGFFRSVLGKAKRSWCELPGKRTKMYT